MKSDIFTKFDNQAVLRWYDGYGRSFPWRRRWPDLAPAYHVFLSEFMLQQTGVKTVIPYFERFTAKWPDIFALAQADIDEVLADWAGLGYYARARNMHKTASVIANMHGGKFPDTEAELRKLPGIGPYTAGAILRFAFDKPAIVLDGNIERILLRFGGIEKPVSEAKPLLQDAFAVISPPDRHADFPQALMDMASLVCQPKVAHCQQCPLEQHCKAAKLDVPETLPVKLKRQAQPIRTGQVYVMGAPNGRFLMYRRPEKGLLGGMLAFPSVGWDKSQRVTDELQPMLTKAKPIGKISHIFTHFKAEITVFYHQLDEQEADHIPAAYHWQDDNPSDWPKLMQKCRAIIGKNS